MPQTLSILLVHIIFSTKDRRPLVREDLREGLHAYLATTVRSMGCECYRVGNVADHVHLAVRFSRLKNVSEVVQEVKRASSKWIKTQGVVTFAWQRGYAAFSVGPKDREALVQYVAD